MSYYPKLNVSFSVNNSEMPNKVIRLKSATPMKLNQGADAGNKKSKFVFEFGLNYFDKLYYMAAN
jgi:hypothetical protein